MFRSPMCTIIQKQTRLGVKLSGGLLAWHMGGSGFKPQHWKKKKKRKKNWSAIVWTWNEVAPRAYVSKAWSQGWFCWEVEEILRGGTQQVSSNHWGCILGADRVLSFFLFHSWIWGKQFCSIIGSHHDVFVQPQAQNQPCTETLSQNKSIFFLS